LTVSNEELEAEYQKMSESIDKTVEEIREIYNQNKNGLEFFKHAMMEKKAVQMILDASTIEEVEAKAETSEEDSNKIED
jgi:trigger factor